METSAQFLLSRGQALEAIVYYKVRKVEKLENVLSMRGPRVLLKLAIGDCRWLCARQCPQSWYGAITYVYMAMPLICLCLAG